LTKSVGADVEFVSVVFASNRTRPSMRRREEVGDADGKSVGAFVALVELRDPVPKDVGARV